METFFASAERLDRHELAIEIDLVNQHPIMSGLLHSVGGLLAVADEHRQIVALNDSFLKMIGIRNPEKVLGLRLGEVLNCDYAKEAPAGCGTTKYCSSCGAAIAMVTSLGSNTPAERICHLSANRNESRLDLALMVRSQPIDIDQKRFLLLFLQDITQQQNRSVLERSFFHDISNLVTMLLGASELMAEEHPASDLAQSIYQAASRLSKEVAIQRHLTRGETALYQTAWQNVPLRRIVTELSQFFLNHPAASRKNVNFPKDLPELSITTDPSLIQRILSNMVLNALEASPENGAVKLWVVDNGSELCFRVWNQGEIPDAVAQRIFQRNFSTKSSTGRGIGTFSMKLFGEKILGGKVSFDTSRTDGTTFTYAVPR